MSLAFIKRASLVFVVCMAAVVMGRCYVLWVRVKTAAFAGSRHNELMAETAMLGSGSGGKWFDLEKGVTINNTVGRWTSGTQAAEKLCDKSRSDGWTDLNQEELPFRHELPLKGALFKRQAEVKFILPWELPDGRQGAFDWTIDLANVEAMVAASAGGGDLPGADIQGVPRMEGWSRRFSMAGSGVNMAGYLCMAPYATVAGEVSKLMIGKGWALNGSVTNVQGVWQSYRSGSAFCNLWAGNGGNEKQTYIMMVKYGE